MIKFAEAKIALARAIHNLLSESEAEEWFSVAEITQRSVLDIGNAFASRVLKISQEEDEIFDSDSDNYWTLGKEGFDLIEAQGFVDLDIVEDSAPASNRVVRFNHNAPDAEEIAAQLAQVSEDVRGANGPEMDEQERERIFSALNIAKDIWQSANFRLIQLKVGVLIAVEDAAVLLAKTSKHVAAAMLIDAIKAFAKNHFHADLDHI